MQVAHPKVGDSPHLRHPEQRPCWCSLFLSAGICSPEKGSGLLPSHSCLLQQFGEHAQTHPNTLCPALDAQDPTILVALSTLTLLVAQLIYRQLWSCARHAARSPRSPRSAQPSSCWGLSAAR